MAIQITTQGESYQLNEQYTIGEVERDIAEAIREGRPVVRLRNPRGHLIVFSIGGTAPLELSDYDPGMITFDR